MNLLSLIRKKLFHLGFLPKRGQFTYRVTRPHFLVNYLTIELGDKYIHIIANKAFPPTVGGAATNSLCVTANLRDLPTPMDKDGRDWHDAIGHLIIEVHDPNSLLELEQKLIEWDTRYGPVRRGQVTPG